MISITIAVYFHYFEYVPLCVTPIHAKRIAQDSCHSVAVRMNVLVMCARASCVAESFCMEIVSEHVGQIWPGRTKGRPMSNRYGLVPPRAGSCRTVMALYVGNYGLVQNISSSVSLTGRVCLPHLPHILSHI